MTVSTQWYRGAAACALIAMAGCSSQDDTIDVPVVRPVSVAPAGIYEGNWTSTSTGASTAVTAFVDSGSTMMMFDASGDLISSGAYATVESARGMSLSSRVFEPGTVTDPDTGETTATTVVTTLTGQGSYAEEESVLMSYTRSTGDTGSISLIYDEDAYETRSDVSLIQGRWGIKDAFGTATISITIDAGGNFSGSDTGGCNYSGAFAPVAQQYNLYTVSIKTSCSSTTGTAAVIPDTAGLATLQAATSTTKKTLVSVSNSTTTALLWKLNPL